MGYLMILIKAASNGEGKTLCLILRLGIRFNVSANIEVTPPGKLKKATHRQPFLTHSSVILN